MIFSLIVFLLIWYWWQGGFSKESWPQRGKFFRVLLLSIVGVIGYLALLVLMFSIEAGAQTTHQTFKNASGQTIGRSSTDARGNTTFYNPLGQQTGRAATNGSGTTFYDRMGRQTGSTRK